MFKKVLYPTDFSKVARKALDYIIKLKEAGAEEIVLVHVVENYDLELMVTACEWKSNSPEKCVNKIENDLRKKSMKKLKELGEKTGMKYKIILEFGKPFSKIVKTAEDEDVSLIVMGSHGKGEFEELLIGSVTENVIRHTKKPVLVIR